MLDLRLQKNEIPITESLGFKIPIHPLLLTENVAIDPTLAHTVFAQAFAEWHADLQAYIQSAKPGDETKHIREQYLVPGIKVQIQSHRQVIVPLLWEDQCTPGQNGFATSLSISRNGGGSLYLGNVEECKSLYLADSRSTRINARKLEQFAAPGEHIKDGMVRCYTYAHHNVDRYPGALFLRNWALLYVNAAMESIRLITKST